jgi:cell wall assembly regulator SMI1
MESWRRLITALGDAAPRLRLRPPATEAAIAGAEALFERPLPAPYRAWLAIADGQEPDALSVLPQGGWFYPLATVVETWLGEAKFHVRELDDEPAPPDALVRPVVFHPTRITIGGDELALREPVLDLWPGPRGTVGQVLSLVSECDFAVIGTSLDDLFTRTANLVLGGQLYPRDVDGAEMLVRTSPSWVDLVERRAPGE